MAVNRNQTYPVYASGNTEYAHGFGAQVTGLRPTERLFIEKTLLRIYPRLQKHDLFPWNLINGPLIPDFLVKNTNPNLRRIVVIGCGDGALCNMLSLLFPYIEIIGLDPNAEKIAYARSTVGHRQNLKFLCGNAATMLDIPCDRIIYDQCLSLLGNSVAFKKLLVKTLRWLVNEGDFIVREAPLKLLCQPTLLRQFWPRVRESKSLDACIPNLLEEIGYSTPQVSACQRIPGLPAEVYYRSPKIPALPSPVLPAPAILSTKTQPKRENVAEWQDLGEQSTHSVLGFLFSKQQADFRRELE